MRSFVIKHTNTHLTIKKNIHTFTALFDFNIKRKKKRIQSQDPQLFQWETLILEGQSVRECLAEGQISLSYAELQMTLQCGRFMSLLFCGLTQQHVWMSPRSQASRMFSTRTDYQIILAQILKQVKEEKKNCIMKFLVCANIYMSITNCKWGRSEQSLDQLPRKSHKLTDY